MGGGLGEVGKGKRGQGEGERTRELQGQRAAVTFDSALTCPAKSRQCGNTITLMADSATKCALQASTRAGGSQSDLH